jgi:hypothetical protein
VNLLTNAMALSFYTNRSQLIFTLLLVVFYLSSAQNTRAEVVIDQGSFQVSDTNLSQEVSHTLGVTPKAIIVYSTASAAYSTTNADIEFGMGISTGPSGTSRCVTYTSQNGVTTPNTSHRIAEKLLVVKDATAASLFIEATISAWDTDSFTITLSASSNTYIFNYIIIGGSDVQAKIVEWNVPTTEQNYSVTGMGFKPDLVFNLGARVESPAVDTTTDHAEIMFGAFNIAGEQFVQNLLSRDFGSATNSQTVRYQRTTSCLAFNDSTTFVQEASFVSMDTDGFTLNHTTAYDTVGGGKAFSLGLKGIRTKIGTLTKPSSASGAPDQSVTGMGFTPEAIMLSSVINSSSSSYTDHAMFSLGFASAVGDESSATVNDIDALGTTDSNKWISNTRVYVQNEGTDGALEADADLKTLDAAGFTIDWITNSSTSATEIIYIGFDEPATQAAPTGLSATPGNTRALLQWTAASSAVSYTVKRSTTNGGPYTNVATVVNSTQYVDSGLTNGTTYYYVVSATSTYDIESSNSAQASATPNTTSDLTYYASGNYTVPTTTGQKTINHDLGMVPKAIIVYAAGNAAFNSGENGMNFGFGFTDLTRSRSVSYASQHNVTTPNTTHRYSTKLITVLDSDASGVLFEASYVSCTSTTFTIDLTTAPASGKVLSYILIGGDNVQAYLKEWNLPTSSGNNSVTGVGFKPDAVIHIAARVNNINADTDTSHSEFTLGAMNNFGEQWVQNVFSYDHASAQNSDTFRVQRTDQTLSFSNGGGASQVQEASYVSMDADGFTLNHSSAFGSGGAEVFSLCLKGIHMKLGSFTKSTDTGAPDQAVTGLGMRPRLVVLSSVAAASSTSVQTHSALSFGHATAVGAEGSMAFWDQNNVGTTVSSKYHSDARLLVLNEDSDTTNESYGDLKSFDGNGFTIDWAGNSSLGAQIVYMAFSNHYARHPGSTRVKSVQSGTATFAASATKTVTLTTTVDASKSFLVFGTAPNTNTVADTAIRGSLNSSGTTLTFTRYGTSGTPSVIWYVAEFGSGVKVQRGSVNISNTSTNVTLSSPVDLTKAVPMISFSNSGNDYNEDDFIRASLTSSTNLRLNCTTNNGTSDDYVEWQVVEFEDSVVSSGTVVMDTTETSDTATVSCPDTSKCWLIYSNDSNSGNNADIGDKFIRGKINSTTEIKFDRDHRYVANPSSHNIDWYLVRFTDSTRVLNGTTTTSPVALSPAIDTAASIACGGYNCLGGMTSYTTTDNPGAGWFTQGLAASSLTLTRGGALGTYEFGYFVIQFPSGSTAVKLDSFTASAHPNGTLLQWRTEHESDNLGFHIYREINGKRERITQTPIPGSALVTGGTYDLASGKSYKWRDDFRADQNTIYWLEDLDINGKNTLHGPVTPTFNRAHLVNRPDRNDGIASVNALSSPAIATSSVNSANFGLPGPTPSASSIRREVQFTVASKARLKVLINSPGIYRITQSELVAAGLDSNINPRRLQLYVDGTPVPMNVIGEADNRFDSSDYIEFYATGLDSLSTTTRTYYLLYGNIMGSRIAPDTVKLQEREESDTLMSRNRRRPVNRAPLAILKVGQPTTSSSLHSVERSDKSIYFSGFLNGDKGNFFGPVVQTSAVNQTLTLTNVDSSKSDYASLEVSLVGVTSYSDTPDHKVEVKLNGRVAGEVVFDGRAHKSDTMQVPQSWLNEGSNTVTLTGKFPAEITLVDRIQLSYWKRFSAESNVLYAALKGGDRIEAYGFTTRNLKALDITEIDRPEEIRAEIFQQQNTFTARLAVPGTSEKRVLIYADTAVKRNATITLNSSSSLNSSQNSADYLIVSHSDFKSSLNSLKSLRESEGLKVQVIDTEDIYDEFGYGAKSGTALADFFEYAHSKWQKTPSYILLVGDASFDPLNRLKMGAYDYVPTAMIDSATMETSSDDTLADFDRDGISDINLGRLPARTTTDVERMVDKIVAQERTGTWRDLGVLLVSDKNDSINFFESTSDILKGLVKPGISVEEIKAGSSGAASARAQIITELNEGKRLVNYVGHGSVGVWSNMLTTSVASNLQNVERPVFTLMNCLNGYYHDVFSESMAEALIKARSGGAVAVWASSAQTDMIEQSAINQDFYEQMFRPGLLRLGDAVRKAKAATRDKNVRRSWILFGDPAMRVK